jgi:N utilization substance protein A
MRGQRVQAVVGELQGEKVDIIQWNQDAATFIVNALAPAEVTKVVLDEDSNRIEVVVPESQLSLAIGRRGQNVRLASQLTGWDIDILTEQEESERRQKEFTERSQLFMEALDVDEVIAQLLATEGFETVAEVAYVDAGEIAHIEGFDEDTAKRSRRAPASTWSVRRPSGMPSARLWVSPTSWPRLPASTRPCWWPSGRTTSRPWRTWPAR